VARSLSAGTRVKALDWPPSQQSFHNTSVLNISATTYGNGDPEVAVRFQAPSSGRVAVHVGAGTRNNSANADRLFVTFRVLVGDPNNSELFQTEDVKLGVSIPATQTDDYQYHGTMTMVDGLVPGGYYYAQVRHRTTLGSGTADIAHRHITIFPIS
jgi:hypothetical protein